VLLLAQSLREHGHEQRIASPPESALTAQARKRGLQTIPLTGAFSLRSHLGACQIVHSHSGHAQTVAYLATMNTGLVRVTTRHVAFEPRNKFIHRWKYTATCHGIIAISEAVREALLKAGVPDGKIEVIANGIALPAGVASAETRSAARRQYGFTNADFVAGHLGAFSPEKGQDVAVAAHALLRDKIPHLRMILAGESPTQVRASGVITPGFVENREEFFAALDVFIMPSRSEGWGLAAAEALAHGVPVIASATGGLPEIVGSGETGWLVTPGDPTALADAIQAAAKDPERLRLMGVRARERSVRFSIARTADLTERFYTRILQARG
jgi:glycosyltransferase involved in cell wall biosynthesis